MDMQNIYKNPKAQWIAYIIFFLAVLSVPLITSEGYTFNLLGTYGVYAMLALSISIVWGYGGVLNLGQGIPFGLAAYGMAMTMQMQSQDAADPMPPFMLNNSLTSLPFLWQPFQHTYTGIVLSLAVPTILWMIFGSIMFAARVSGGFVSVMTLALLSAINLLVLDLQPYTNGANGITPPNPLKIFGSSIDPYSAKCYLIVAAFLITFSVISKIVLNGMFGLITHAVRSDSERTRFLGYNVFAYQTVLFGISGFIAAAAGCLFVMLVQYVSPAQLDVSFSVGMVIWAGVGGRMSLLWSMIGAILINSAQTIAGDTFLNTWLLLLGMFFIVVVRFLPFGLAGVAEKLLSYIPVGTKMKTQSHQLHVGVEN